jgi:hypothetical protein
VGCICRVSVMWSFFLSLLDRKMLCNSERVVIIMMLQRRRNKSYWLCNALKESRTYSKLSKHIRVFSSVWDHCTVRWPQNVVPYIYGAVGSAHHVLKWVSAMYICKWPPLPVSSSVSEITAQCAVTSECCSTYGAVGSAHHVLKWVSAMYICKWPPLPVSSSLFEITVHACCSTSGAVGCARFKVGVSFHM